MDDGVINVCGRSWGRINVQVILEKIGGGGHMTVAGAQLREATVDEAKSQIINAVELYFEERENK